MIKSAIYGPSPAVLCLEEFDNPRERSLGVVINIYKNDLNVVEKSARGTRKSQSAASRRPYERLFFGNDAHRNAQRTFSFVQAPVTRDLGFFTHFTLKATLGIVMGALIGAWLAGNDSESGFDSAAVTGLCMALSVMGYQEARWGLDTLKTHRTAGELAQIYAVCEAKGWLKNRAPTLKSLQKSRRQKAFSIVAQQALGELEQFVLWNGFEEGRKIRDERQLIGQDVVVEILNGYREQTSDAN